MSCNTLNMFYKGQSLRDARQNFEKNKGQSPIVQGTKIHWHGKGHRQNFVNIKGRRQIFVKNKEQLC